MGIELDDGRRRELIADLRGFFEMEFGEELSGFRAEQLLAFVVGAVGPQVYNQAVQDARAFMLRKLEDLEGEVYVAEAG